MKARRTLRLISLVMLIVAIVFIFRALSAPNLGHTIYIGSFKFGAEQYLSRTETPAKQKSPASQCRDTGEIILIDLN